MDARRRLFRGLIDDAGLFPPAGKSMVEALADHRQANTGAHAWMLGRFLCPSSRLRQLAETLGDDEHPRVGVVCDSACEDWQVALQADVMRAREYHGSGVIDALEARLPEGAPSHAVVETALRIVARARFRRVPLLFLEVPTGDLEAIGDWIEAIADAGGAGAKIRCGGLSAEAFPSDEAVAKFVACACAFTVPFKATAGLHHPFRTWDEEIGVLQHGFLNMLAASAIEGGERIDVIAESDPEAFEISPDGLSYAGRTASRTDIQRARRLFTGYGSCSFAEPVADLVAQGLLESEPSPATS